MASTTEEDFYALLGVGRNCTEDDLKKAYRKLARELHPDANPGDAAAEEKFKKVALAYEVLRDPQRRQQYDTYGINGIRGAGAGGGSQEDIFGFGGMNLGDLFDSFFGGQGSSPFGGGGRRGPAGPPPGPDVEAFLSLSFEEALFGGEKEVKLKLPVTCATCDGSGAAAGTSPVTCSTCEGQGEVRRVRQSILGQMVTSSPCPQCAGTGQNIQSPCPDCRGEGRRTQERAYPVEIPGGIDRGQTLRITGRGGAGARGGPTGDLYVRIDVAPDDRFQRDGHDLVHVLNISMVQAALGAHIKLKTFDGAEDIYIDAGTQNGKVFKFRGKGVPVLNSRGQGDWLFA